MLKLLFTILANDCSYFRLNLSDLRAARPRRRSLLLTAASARRSANYTFPFFSPYVSIPISFFTYDY